MQHWVLSIEGHMELTALGRSTPTHDGKLKWPPYFQFQRFDFTFVIRHYATHALRNIPTQVNTYDVRTNYLLYR